MVNISEAGRHDLSFSTLENVDLMSLEDIQGAINKNARLIRTRKDPHLGFALNLIGSLPWFMTRLFLNVYSFLTHDLNINLQKIRLPHIPLGSIIITNVGSLGIKKALVPLVPFSRSAMLLSVGEITKEARVVNDTIQIRKIMHLGVTFDHRFFDGSQAAAMIRDFEFHFHQL
jgi:pyruvate dehydrogenase E2 component (dihydrolipoamide acetyltransferase)